MGSIDFLKIINDWHQEEDKEYCAITGNIDLQAKVRLAQKLELVFGSSGKAPVIHKPVEIKGMASGASIHKPRRGRPPKGASWAE